METVVKPRKLWEHLVRVFHLEFSSFDRRKFWYELGVGSVLAVLLLISIHSGLSVRADWDEHPILVLAPFVLPFSIVLADALWRVAKALARLYRERRQSSFRDAVHVFVVLVAGWVIVIGGIIWYLDYVTSPHFTMAIFDVPDINGVPGKTQERIAVAGGYGIGETDDARQPSTSVLFFQAHVKNSGIPSAAHNWRLKAKVSGAPDAIEGEIRLQNVWMTEPKDTSQKHFIFSIADFIFGRSEQPFKGTLGGAAYFIFPGVSPENLKAPGTKLTLSCQDDIGKTYKVSTIVTAKSTLLKSFSSPPPLPATLPAPIQPQREIIIPEIDVAPYVQGQRVEAKLRLRHINNPNENAYHVCFQIQVGPSGMAEKSWGMFRKQLNAGTATCTTDINIPFQNDLVVTESTVLSPHAIDDLMDGKKWLYLAGVVVGQSGDPQTSYCAIKAPHMQAIEYCRGHN